VVGKVVTLKNAGDAEISVVQLIATKTTLAPGEELELDPATQRVEIQ